MQRVKLFQTKQSFMINEKPTKKAHVLNGKKNHRNFHLQVAKKGYILIFTSFKIAFSKNFQKNILDNFEFTDYLFLFAINKIYLND